MISVIELNRNEKEVSKGADIQKFETILEISDSSSAASYSSGVL
jgi:hypothetical protein